MFQAETTDSPNFRLDFGSSFSVGSVVMRKEVRNGGCNSGIPVGSTRILITWLNPRFDVGMSEIPRSSRCFGAENGKGSAVANQIGRNSFNRCTR